MKIKLSLLVFLMMILVGCAGKETAEQPMQNVTQSTQSQTAENESVKEEPYILMFLAETIDGKLVASTVFSESKITMLNVWATYCNPCLEEMPDLGELAASYEDEDFQIYGIISDVMVESPEADKQNAGNLIEQTKADYPHLLLNESLYQNLVSGVSSVPTTFFVNSKGEMLGYVVGANDKETWEQIIDELLEKESQ